MEVIGVETDSEDSTLQLSEERNRHISGFVGVGETNIRISSVVIDKNS